MGSKHSGLGIRGSRREAGFWVLGAGCWVFLGVLATTAASPRGIAKESAEPNPLQELRIELHVYDYAGVEAREWARAQGEAARVLQQSGIAVTWVNCVVPAKDATNARACPSADGQLPALVLHVLPRAMAERAWRGKGLLGFAQLAEDGAPADTAFVFYHRVESLAAELRCARGVILGYALAHEVGHLLLGTNSHSPNGIMCAHWTEKELRLASTGFFGFFPQQAAKIRAEVRQRVANLAAGAESDPKLTVTIYNYAQVPSATLAEAETVATRIFERAGIESSWQEYDATASASAPVAKTLDGQNWVHITVHICSRSMASHLPVNRTYLGFAVVPGGKDHGDMAYVFYHRAQELAGERSLSVADSLGHVLAHEIGHLLLGASSHSPWGLMRARWDQEDLRRAAKGWLIFTADEGERLRADVRARQQEAGVLHAAAALNK